MAADHKTLMALLDHVRDTCTVHMQRPGNTQAALKVRVAMRGGETEDWPWEQA
jgi:hypothetical protein